MTKTKNGELIEKLHRIDILHALIFDSEAKGVLPVHVRQIPILRYISEHEGCTQAEVSEELGVSAQSIAQSAKRLEQTGNIERSTDENNMRCNMLYITAQGRASIKNADEIIKYIDDKTLEGISNEEIAFFSDILDRMLENISCDEQRNAKVCELMRMICNNKEDDK